MKNVTFYIITLFFISITSCSVAQPGMKYTTENKKAIKYYEQARTCFNNVDPLTGKRALECAIDYSEKALEKDPNFAEAYALISNSYIEQGNLEKAIEYKQKMMTVTTKFSQSEYFYLASMQIAIGDYANCRKNAQRYLQVRNGNPTFIDKCKQYIANCDFAIEAKAHPYDYAPQNLGPNINTDRPEYFPSLTADDQTLLFTRLIEDPNAKFGGAQEDMFVAQANGDHWSLATPLSKNVNSIYNEGAPTFSADGKYAIFVGCETGNKGDYDYGDGREGYGSCDLFVSEKVGDNWSKPFNLGAPVNSKHWESQPSFSSDGKTLYFIRGIIHDRQLRAPKEQDIYMTQLTPEGNWSKPIKLSNKINTPYREESVQIHPDGQTLYFSSEGHVGMGGTDIFMSRLDENGEWGKPVNLGYPINSHKNENSTLVSAEGDFAYFASNREGGYGSLDLYSFELPEQFRPIKTNYMKGKVFDKETKKPLAARFQLIDLKTGKVVKSAIANSGNGEFIVALPVNSDFALIAEHKGYFFYSKNYSLDKLTKTEEGFEFDVPMRPIKKGDSFVLENIFFDVDKWDLKPESIVELNKLLEVLQNNSELKIELGGHTDSDGNDAHNQQLSENRAKAVVDWLISKGIATERLSYKGYGEEKPIAPNDSPENKAMNRRTEVTIM